MRELLITDQHATWVHPPDFEEVGTGLASDLGWLCAATERACESALLQDLSHSPLKTQGRHVCVGFSEAGELSRDGHVDVVLTEVDRSRLIFQVRFFDATGKLFAAGTHQRHVVS